MLKHVKYKLLYISSHVHLINRNKCCTTCRYISKGRYHQIRLRKFYVLFGKHKATSFLVYKELNSRFRSKNEVSSKTIKKMRTTQLYSVYPLHTSTPCTLSSCLSVPPLVPLSSPSYSESRSDTAVCHHKGPQCVSAVTGWEDWQLDETAARIM